MRSDLNIFKYKRLPPFLEDIGKMPSIIGRKRASLKIWADKLGYQSPRSVGMIFGGRRLPSSAMSNRLCVLLKLNSEERDYYFSLLALERLNEKDPERLEIISRIEKANPQFRNELRLSEFRFNLIADWHYIVIKQLLQNSKETLTPTRLAKILKNKITIAQAEEALLTLQELNLVNYNSTTKTFQSTSESFVTTQDIPSSAIRSHHKQMMMRASEALEEEKISDREFTTATFSFARENIHEVKDLIRNFRDRLEKLYAKNDTQDIYQLNIQFFSHTQGKNEQTPSK